MPMRVFLRDSPRRAIALATDSHVLTFRHIPTTVNLRHNSAASLGDTEVPRCIVEFSSLGEQDMQGYRSLSSLSVQGTLGLVTLNNDVFLCVVSGSAKVAAVNPGESIQRISGVEFHCLSRADYDHFLHDQVNPFPTSGLDADGNDHDGFREPFHEHPCLALKKLLSGGSFYYSADIDLTKRLQDRPTEVSTVAIDSLDGGFLWNAYMIQPLVDFRSRLPYRQKQALDDSRILTSAIRGFAATVAVPASCSPLRARATGMPSTMTLISRLSCRRAGTRFHARGIDDDGHVANFVETETIFSTDTKTFSYVQCRGSVPIFWEQASGLPGQQKIQITRSVEASQPAFDRHFQRISGVYGDTVVVNLLSDEKAQEVQLTQQYLQHIKRSPLNQAASNEVESGRQHLSAINYDFHAETRGPNGYDAAKGIKRWIESSARAFEYFLAEDVQEQVTKDGRKQSIIVRNDVLKQAGIFRTNCLDCLDRTNLVQTIVSEMAFEIFLRQEGEQRPNSDFWARHGTLWADNGDQLSKIYAGTGALKSSFTRSGKMSLAGALADLRKSAQRLYINNVEDKGRQETIDMLLGHSIGQTPVHLHDPVNDWVQSELSKRQAEFTSTENINIWVGTFNVNGKTNGIHEDLTPWLCPDVDDAFRVPEIVAVAFQEIVELDVQQIMSTDPHRRQAWEEAVRKTLNANARRYQGEDYVLLRGGQLVGASLSVFVRASVLPLVKNVEGAVKKTGLSGMAGNKGAVAIRMDYADTSICFVTAHLAAGFANYEERNQDYRTISGGLHFQRNRTIEDHKTIIWFGDFNYRIGMKNEETRQMVKKGDLETLYANDQLNLQMVHGKCFPHYSEKMPCFPPTYKFNFGTDEYDTSDKARIPAWCDRILTRGINLRQIYYDSAPLKFSDHRPVWGLFQCTISVVEQAKKDKVSSELHQKRRASVGEHIASQGAGSDDESLIGYESIEPGLPPASSDKQKWWLNNGMPAKSTIQPPGVKQGPNPARPSNPFTPTNEPDWVEVEDPSEVLSSPVPMSYLSASPMIMGEPRPRRALQPYQPTESASTSSQARPSILDGTGDNETPRVHLKQTLRKAAPVKPNKPSLLRAYNERSGSYSKAGSHFQESRHTSTPSAPVSRDQLTPSLGRSSAPSSFNGRSPGIPPPAPPPRRVMGRTSADDNAPTLRPRGGPPADLMNEKEDDCLKDWVPLKPQ